MAPAPAPRLRQQPSALRGARHHRAGDHLHQCAGRGSRNQHQSAARHSQLVPAPVCDDRLRRHQRLPRAGFVGDLIEAARQGDGRALRGLRGRGRRGIAGAYRDSGDHRRLRGRGRGGWLARSLRFLRVGLRRRHPGVRAGGGIPSSGNRHTPGARGHLCGRGGDQLCGHDHGHRGAPAALHHLRARGRVRGQARAESLDRDHAGRVKLRPAGARGRPGRRGHAPVAALRHHQPAHRGDEPAGDQPLPLQPEAEDLGDGDAAGLPAGDDHVGHGDQHDRLLDQRDLAPVRRRRRDLRAGALAGVRGAGGDSIGDRRERTGGACPSRVVSALRPGPLRARFGAGRSGGRNAGEDSRRIAGSGTRPRRLGVAGSVFLSAMAAAALWAGVPRAGLAQAPDASVPGDLTTLFEIGGLVLDTNGDEVPDFVNASLVTGESPTGAETRAAAEIAARLGFETMALDLPVARGTAAEGVLVVVGRGGLAASGLVSPGVDPASLDAGEGAVVVREADGRRWMVVVGGDDEGLIAAARMFAGVLPHTRTLSAPLLGDAGDDVRAALEESGVEVEDVRLWQARARAGSDGVNRLIANVEVAAADVEEAAGVLRALAAGEDVPTAAGQDAPTEEEADPAAPGAVPAGQEAAQDADSDESDDPFAYPGLGSVEVRLASGPVVRIPGRAAPDAPGPVAGRPGSGGKGSLDLSNLYTPDGLLGDSDNNEIPDRVDALLAPGAAAVEALPDLAARLGLEATGLVVPLVEPAAGLDRPASRPTLVLVGTENPLTQQLADSGRVDLDGPPGRRGTHPVGSRRLRQQALAGRDRRRRRGSPASPRPPRSHPPPPGRPGRRPPHPRPCGTGPLECALRPLPRGSGGHRHLQARPHPRRSHRPRLGRRGGPRLARETRPRPRGPRPRAGGRPGRRRARRDHRRPRRAERSAHLLGIHHVSLRGGPLPRHRRTRACSRPPRPASRSPSTPA